jgi:hypothetical protein
MKIVSLCVVVFLSFSFDIKKTKKESSFCGKELVLMRGAEERREKTRNRENSF